MSAASVPVRKSEIFGWAMFDFANSSYITVVITVIFSGFFTQKVVPADWEGHDSYWSLAIVIATLFALVISPLAGAICDKQGTKKPYLLAATLLCSATTMMLGLVGPGDVWLAVALISISYAAFMVSETFCGSFLPELATPETMGKISGLGWGLGYFGGLASLVLVMGIVGDATGDAAISRTQLAMVATGAFFMIAALPTLLLVRTRARPAPGFEDASLGKLMRAGLDELSQSYETARAHPILLQFLIAFMVYVAGLESVIKFVGIYATAELKFATADLTIMFLILQISAAAGALLFGVLEARFGAKNTVLATLGLWVVAVLAIYWLDGLSALLGLEARKTFFGISLVAGMGIGATQSSSRTVVGLLSPPERAGEMFGFWGTFARLGGILGTGFGLVSDLVSRRSALLLVVAFFVVGAALLARIPIERAAGERSVA